MYLSSIYWSSVRDFCLVAAAYVALYIVLPYFLLGFSGRRKLEKIVISLTLSHTVMIVLSYILLFCKIYYTVSLWVAVVLLSGFLFWRNWRRRFVRRLNRTAQHASLTMDGLHSGRLNRQKFWMRVRSRFVYRVRRIRLRHVINGTVLVLCLLIILYYRTYHAFTQLQFATSDMYVHLEWIKYIEYEQKMFSSGVYPQGMHLIGAALSMMFGFNPYEIMMYLGPITSIFAGLAFYFVLTKMFRSMAAVNFVFIFFTACWGLSEGYLTRLMATLPQEFPYMFIFPCGYFLWQYLYSRRRVYAWMWGLCIAMTLFSHFFTTMAAGLISVGVALCAIHRVVRWRQLRVLLVSFAGSLALSVAPLIVGLLMGIPWEGSMGWALSGITGTEGEPVSRPPFQPNLLPERFQSSVESPLNGFWAEYALPILYLAIVVTAVLLLFKSYRRYGVLLLGSELFVVLLLVLMNTETLALPSFMPFDRSGAYLSYAISLVFGLPIEAGYLLTERWKVPRRLYAVVSSLAIVWLGYYTFWQGNIRGRGTSFQMQYSGTVEAYYQILRGYPAKQWTIVSPVEEYSMSRDDGFHYELVEFIYEMQDYNDNMRLEIPTNHVFFFVEKRPLQSPRLLSYNEPYTYMETWNAEDARAPIEYDPLSPLNNYREYDSRRTLEAKARLWADTYMRYYPKEMSVFYEDEEIIVYHIEQHPYALNNFAIDYGYN